MRAGRHRRGCPGGLTAVLLVCALLLQSFGAGVGQLALGAGPADALEQVICLAGGGEEIPAEDKAPRDACLALCQLACSSSLFLPAGELRLRLEPLPSAGTRPTRPHPATRSADPVLPPEARAPPASPFDARPA